MKVGASCYMISLPPWSTSRTPICFMYIWSIILSGGYFVAGSNVVAVECSWMGVFRPPLLKEQLLNVRLTISQVVVVVYHLVLWLTVGS